MARGLPDVERVKKELSGQLEMKDMKELSTFLGVNFIRDEGGAWLSQSHYCTEVLRRFGMSACKAVKTPASTSSEVDASYSTLEGISKYQELVGSLLFLATRTRPDIALAVNLLTRHCASPTTNNMIAAKRVLRYLKGTEGFALRLENSPREILSAFSDADWAGDRTDRKSTTGILLQLGETSIAWKSSKQSVRKSSGCALCWKNSTKTLHIPNNLRRNYTKIIRPRFYGEHMASETPSTSLCGAILLRNRSIDGWWITYI